MSLLALCFSPSPLPVSFCKILIYAVSVFLGICIIINNKDFEKDPNRADAKQMKSREGTDVDKGRPTVL